jgi:colicin import membrane protein
MKSPILFICLLLLPFWSFSQSRKVLQARINELTAKIETVNAEVRLLSEQNKNLSSEIAALRIRLSDTEKEMQALNTRNPSGMQPSVNSSQADSGQNRKATATNRCKAITTAGNQCSRNAQEGSDYCWQHAKAFESSKTSASPGNSINSNTGTREIMTGPRGGKYYINSNGKKTYIRKK